MPSEWYENSVQRRASGGRPLTSSASLRARSACPAFGTASGFREIREIAPEPRVQMVAEGLVERRGVPDPEVDVEVEGHVGPRPQHQQQGERDRERDAGGRPAARGGR